MVVLPSTGGPSSTNHNTVPLITPTSEATMVPNPLTTNGGIFPVYAPHVPFSLRKAPPLDMSTVERRGHPQATREMHKRVRPHGLEEAPTFRPTVDEFKDPMEYIRKIAPEGRKYGICKIIPPDSWQPEFAINTEKFHFRTRRQELNSVEGSTRANLNYLDQLARFHKQHGMNLNRFPSVDKRPLDLYKLKKAVECRGGFDKVCKFKKWAEIGRDLGYSGKIMSSLSTSLKNSYQKWLNPYEEYLRVAKPGVQMQIEHEYGGPMTPSPANSPLKRTNSHQHTPSSLRDDSPAMRASAALNSSYQSAQGPLQGPPQGPPPALPPVEVFPAPVPDLRPPMSSGFTPVNSGGFTPVNLTPASFQPVNSVNPPLKWEIETIAPISRPSGAPTNFIAMHHQDNQGTPTSAPKMISNTHLVNSLKRTISHESFRLDNGTDSGSLGTESFLERRSKRQKKAPTVVGSHMSLLRPLVPRAPGDRVSGKPGERCEACGSGDDPSTIMACNSCDTGYHQACLEPTMKLVTSDWHCPRCLVGTGEFGFEEGGIYSLRQFQEKAHNFKESYFAPRMPFDVVTERSKQVTEDDVEREFWRLVESITETVEVEYGADIHSTTHGSGFPSLELHRNDPYSTDPWNLNILPLHPESLFRHIKSDISGMTVPWLYVGMCFSTFCWHNEDHYTYSANYQHFGATKTWYGIPGADAERFEEAMRQAVPELFETQPDLLFQLVTLLPPNQLKKAGVNVYALDQRAGQFVITFPQAYHAGFNHGFNFNEAVNFAPSDWEPFGEAGIERLQAFRRQPCFSHDELLMTAAIRDTTIKTAKWLKPALLRMQKREMEHREAFLKRHNEMHVHECPEFDDPELESRDPCCLGFGKDEADLPEEEYSCSFCKAYSFLSRYVCHKSGKVMCMLHAGMIECCDAGDDGRHTNSDHSLRYRYTNEELATTIQKVLDRAHMPEAWQDKLDKLLDDEPSPPLKAMRSLAGEGERIPYHLPGLADLKQFVERCNEWVDEATNYITRRQQNRRKNEKVWRKANSSKAAEMEERDKELRKIENIDKLLADAKKLSFSCPEIDTLQDRSDAIAKFRSDAVSALAHMEDHTTQEYEDLIELGKGFNVDVPEVEQLERVMKQKRWSDQARELKTQSPSLSDVQDLIADASKLDVPLADPHLLFYQDQASRGLMWDQTAKDAIKMEPTHYQQLEILSDSAKAIPVPADTLGTINGMLHKHREAQRQIVNLFEKSKDSEFRRRPKYKAVRDALDSLSELNSKPAGTLDLEKEIKRHEDWMRKGKKLFGKANAPLHILLSHMQLVEERNIYCFDIEDQPRMPVEPPSRQQSPVDGEDMGQGVKSTSDVFCICRKREIGMMIECELCHEWYHGKCLKIARGKVKEEDRYTCPICDYRAKIPRDAARPKLEDLQEWQAEIPTLPFQPEEEDTLDSMIRTASDFRNHIEAYINPVLTTPDEVTTVRFYLRKVEGADVLLARETNFFRQELHRWAPVAPEPPPVTEVSLSTRKPRPTKAQKMAMSLGIDDPDQIPQRLRTKQHTFKPGRKPGDPGSASKPPPLQPAPHAGQGSSTPQSRQWEQRPKQPAPGSYYYSPGQPHYAPWEAPSNFDGYRNNSYSTASPRPHSGEQSHGKPSPSLASSNHKNDHNPTPAAMRSPGPATQSQVGSTNTPLDPGLFSPIDRQFGTLPGDIAGPSGYGTPSHSSLMSPLKDQFSSHHNRTLSSGSNGDRVFAEFTTEGNEDIERNEAGEALEDRGVSKYEWPLVGEGADGQDVWEEDIE